MRSLKGTLYLRVSLIAIALPLVTACNSNTLRQGMVSCKSETCGEADTVSFFGQATQDLSQPLLSVTSRSPAAALTASKTVDIISKARDEAAKQEEKVSKKSQSIYDKQPKKITETSENKNLKEEDPIQLPKAETAADFYQKAVHERLNAIKFLDKLAAEPKVASSSSKLEKDAKAVVHTTQTKIASTVQSKVSEPTDTFNATKSDSDKSRTDVSKEVSVDTQMDRKPEAMDINKITTQLKPQTLVVNQDDQPKRIIRNVGTFSGSNNVELHTGALLDNDDTLEIVKPAKHNIEQASFEAVQPFSEKEKTAYTAVSEKQSDEESHFIQIAQLLEQRVLDLLELRTSNDAVESATAEIDDSAAEKANEANMELVIPNDPVLAEESELVAKEETEKESKDDFTSERKEQIKSSPLLKVDPDAPIMTIAEAVSRAATMHPEIALAIARSEEASAGVKVAKSSLGPQVQTSVGVGQNTVGSFSGDPYDFNTKDATGFGRVDATLSLRQLIYDFNSTRQDVLRNVASADAEKFALMDKTEEISLRTANAYLGIMQQRKLVSLANDNIAAIEKLLRLVEANEQDGNATIADVKRVSARLLEAQTARTDLESDLETAIDEFRRLARIEPGRLVPPQSIAKALPPSAEHALEVMAKHNPRLLSLVYAAKAAEHEIESITARNRPTVNLELDGNVRNYVGQNTRSDVDLRGMVMFSYRLYDSGSNKGQANQAEARLRQVRARYMDRRDDFETEIRQAYRSADAARRKFSALKEGADDSAKVLELYTEQFKAGERTIFELLDAQSSLYLAKRDLTTAQYDELRSRYQILRSAGRLTTTLIGANG
jgi:adhesin transport system outer membrane protein